MDLQQTIDQLEQQAAQYTEAAAALRTLLAQTGGAELEKVAASAAPAAARGNAKRGNGKSSKASSSKAAAPKAASKAAAPKATAPKAAAAKPARGGGKRTVSPETRAKIAAAIRARHEQRRQAEEAGA